MEQPSLNAQTNKVAQVPQIGRIAQLKQKKVQIVAAVVLSASGTALIGAVVKGLGIVLYGH